MKTTIFENANNRVNNLSGAIKGTNAEYHTLSQVWKDVTRTAMLKAGFQSVLDSFGVSAKQSPMDLLKAMHEDLWKETKATKKKAARRYIGIYVKSVIKKDGEFVLNEKGEKTYELKHREVKSWSVKTLVTLLAQNEELSK